MSTASTILGKCRERFGDSSANWITNAVGMNWIDHAQAELNNKFFPLTRLTGFVVAANQEAFTIPSDHIMTEAVWHSRAVRTVMIYKPAIEFFKLKMVAQSATGYPQYYTEFEGRFYVWPMYGTADATVAASGAINATSTTVSLATVTGLQIQGLVSVASTSEIIQYTLAASGQLSGCQRGYAGTTAASFASTGTLTQMTLQVLYKRAAASISTVTDSVELPMLYERAMEEWVLYLAYAAEGSQEKAAAQYQVAQKEFDKLEYIGSRETMDRPMRIIDRL